jgi:hypothetical protein
LPDNYEIVEPKASSLIEALRAVGYTVQTAIADLIDNSVTAKAKNVWLEFGWAGPDSFIRVLDDGEGMSEAELTDAMRPGSRSPLETRSPTDLGRFGLGLKTASFSQARRLTVASRRRGGLVAVRRWDLDYVGAKNEWRLLKTAEPGSEHRLVIDPQPAGTVVLWERLDRIVGDSPVGNRAAQDRFLAMAQSVEDHLAMVFHHYIGGPRPELRIYVNGREERHRVRAWDPFLEDQIATFSPSDAERIRFPEGDVKAKGFVLPHKDKLSEDEYRRAAGPSGWNSQQGFYVYRNRRLLVSGGWLDLGYPNEEHYKLARIRVEIPNSTDADWAIDVKKSRARPPPAVRQRLRELADVVRQRAREVFVHRGRISSGSSSEPLRRLWMYASRDGKLAYRIDRQHPLVKLVLDQAANVAHRKAIDALLRLAEATVPIQKIWLDVAEKPEVHAAPFAFETQPQIREVVSQLYRALIADGVSPDMARERLSNMEPFNALPAFVAHVLDAEA